MEMETINKYNDSLKTIREIRGKWRKNAEGLRLLGTQLAEHNLDTFAIDPSGTAVTTAPSNRMGGAATTICELAVLDGQGLKDDFQRLEQAIREQKKLEDELRKAGLNEIIQPVQ